LDANGDILTTSNTITTGQLTNVYTTKIGADGTLIWEREYNHPANDKDYGAAIATDAAGNVYVAGAVTAANGFFDYIVLKYAANDGTLLWTATHNGASGRHDVPVAIAVDATGNVYVSGGSENGTALVDYCTIKYDSNGNQQWLSHYDYNGLYDAPVALQIDMSGNIIVTGVSADNTLNWESATVKYDAATGVETDAVRVTQTSGIHEPTDFDIDLYGNFYIVGNTITGGTDHDIRTIKLSPELNIEWVEDYDGEGFEDGATAIDVDEDGSVFVGGYTQDANGAESALIIEYDEFGTQVTVQVENNAQSRTTIKDIRTTDDGVLVTGGAEKDGTTEMFVRQYDSSGNLVWQDTRTTGTISIGNNILTNGVSSLGGNVLITGVSTLDDGMTITTTNYNTFTRPTDVITDNEGNPLYMDRMVIVRFHRDAVNTTAVDNTDIIHGRAPTFLTAAAINELNTHLSFDMNQAHLMKVFKRLKSTHTTSESRLGHLVAIPDLWTSFVVVIPESTILLQAQGSVMPDVLQASQEFENITDVVHYAHPNYVLVEDGKEEESNSKNEVTEAKEQSLNSVPNDSEYALNQASLHTTTDYPNANINVETAWTHTTGANHVKIGIVEGGAFWQHDDFSRDGTNTFGGSAFAGGWFFGNNGGLGEAPSDATSGYTNHATKVAGIIGAVRNNSIGIAGITGGDGTANIDGAQLFTFGITSSGVFQFDYAADAIMEASIYTPSYGYGVHLLNNSYGRKPGGPFNDLENLMCSAVKVAFENNVVFVASSGNDAEEMEQVPGNCNEDWVVCVSATGIDGEYMQDGVEPDNCPSNFSSKVDVVAPGHLDIVRTTAFEDMSTLDAYGDFSCTSSAAPHTSGVIGLMMSQHNDPASTLNWLAPEDVENVIALTANDRLITPDDLNAVGHDDYTGHGLIDAGAALGLLNNCDLQHYNAEIDAQNATLVGTNELRNLLGNLNGVAAGQYFMDVYKITATIPHNSNGQTITDADIWKLNSASNLLANTSAIPPYSQVEIVSYDNNQAVMEGYFYHVKTNIIGQSISKWIPYLPNSMGRLSYSLLTCNTTNTTDAYNPISNLALYPNPTSETLTIQYSLMKSDDIKISVLDNLGRQISDVQHNQLPAGEHTLDINIKNLPPAVYMLQLSTEQNTAIEKFVKY